MTLRNLLAIVALLVILGFAGMSGVRLYEDRSVWPPDDFVEYWAAGRLNLNHQNPYSQELLLPLERFAGRDTDEAVMMWNPPWTLAFVMPLGAIPARAGQFVWLFANFAAVLISAVLFWRAYCTKPGKTWVAMAISLTFLPSLFLFQTGQISGIVLLGLALMLQSTRSHRYTLAGVCTILLAIKPHLVYLLWFAVLFEAIYHRRWRIIVGGVLVGVVTTAIAMAYNPQVWAHYFDAYRDYPPAQWVSLTVGSLLRIAFGPEKFWLQFVAPLAGIAWFIRHWQQHKTNWNWASQLPVLTLVSFVTAPYGSWHFDLVLLLMPIIHRAGAIVSSDNWNLERLGIGALVLINGLCLAVSFLGLYSYWFGWVAPAVLVLYFVLTPKFMTNMAAIPQEQPA